MIKENKNHLIASSIVILLPILLGGILWNYFPEMMITHWNLQGQPDGLSSKAFGLFGTPALMLVVQWVGIFFTIKDRKNEDQNRKVFLMIIWIIPIISHFIWMLIVTTSLGISINISKVTLMIVPVMFIAIGNYMPKCKQNYTIGVRVKWTVENKDNWNKTHRFAGRLWVYGGMIMLILVLCISIDRAAAISPFYILFMAFLPILYSYLYNKKQLRAGAMTIEERKNSSAGRKTGIVSIIIIVFIVVFVLRGDYEIQLNEDTISIKTMYWEDVDIPYEKIEKIEFIETKKSGVRIFGYGSLSIVMGECQNDTWGNYTAYLNLRTKPCIIITVDDKILVFNEGNEEETKELYDNLQRILTL